jgi:uncharacterized protein YlxW (UPF0749 family)
MTMDVSNQLASWVPPGLLGIGLVFFFRHYASQLLQRIATLEAKVDQWGKEAADKVSVTDHRESMREIHTKCNDLTKQVVELQTEWKFLHEAKRRR